LAHSQHQNHPNAAGNQFQTLQHNLWHSYNTANMAAAMGMSQQAACHLNPQLCAPGMPSPASYYNLPNLDLTSGSGQQPAPVNHLMQPYAQNHFVLNCAPPAGYGFMNQFVPHAGLPTDHQGHRVASSQVRPQTHQQENVYPGYPNFGYPGNYNH